MKEVITESDIREAQRQRKESISVKADSIITPAARDAAKKAGIAIVLKSQEADTGAHQKSQSGQVVIGSDHGGFEMKEMLRPFIESLGFQVEDVGTKSDAAVDYPDFAARVAREVAQGTAWRGIIVDAVGVGSAMAANKIPGIRAAVGYNGFAARSCREHNDANILTLGGRLIGSELAKEMVRIFLTTEFAGGRHQPRVDKIMALEQKS
ncbi:ribose 5-phosphate isomerase B [candidate division KSB1 bacterium]|nr:ribose 5-phosphate isomerase B [candidate division KSB1 bacterium]